MAQARHAQTARQSGLVAPLSARRGRRAGVGHQVGGPVFLAVLESARRKPGYRGPDGVVVRSRASRDARVLPLSHFTVLSRSVEPGWKQGATGTRTGGEQSFHQRASRRRSDAQGPARLVVPFNARPQWGCPGEATAGTERSDVEIPVERAVRACATAPGRSGPHLGT